MEFDFNELGLAAILAGISAFWIVTLWVVAAIIHITFAVAVYRDAKSLATPIFCRICNMDVGNTYRRCVCGSYLLGYASLKFKLIYSNETNGKRTKRQFCEIIVVKVTSMFIVGWNSASLEAMPQ